MRSVLHTFRHDQLCELNYRTFRHFLESNAVVTHPCNNEVYRSWWVVRPRVNLESRSRGGGTDGLEVLLRRGVSCLKISNIRQSLCCIF